jgi:GAF domain-containing protein
MTNGEGVLIQASRALARADGLASTLDAMLHALDASAAAGLSEAMHQPGHPVRRTFSEPLPTHDVTPMNPGGAALRSHLPLVVRRGGTDDVVGVLALAYDHPMDADRRPVIEAVADLAAVAIQRHRDR